MDTQLYMALYKAFHAQKNRARPRMKQIGLSPGQPKVLRYLSGQDGCMQKEIASALDIEPATVSQILNNMAKNGLVQRAAPLKRRRAESISITEKGRAVYAEWLDLCGAVQKEALCGFSAQEQAMFHEYLRRMYRNLTGKEME